ncbi:hypothetical protein CVT24_012057 [Panaeolus cyanescens]|uniref:Uncharacterized protein n=1 Tax=Panaeolus cyanescens TaxID=181874 RepID=A0A409VHW4_9AGAR|nr:hypothetical protein CVT24_012057 [Panaeolus cyanescens]
MLFVSPSPLQHFSPPHTSKAKAMRDMYSPSRSPHFMGPSKPISKPRSIYKIPVEIWQHIFLFFSSFEGIPELEEIESSLGRPTQTPSSARGRNMIPHSPLVLTQVCRHWRAISLNLPELWTSLFVKGPDLLFGTDHYTLQRKLQNRSQAIKYRLSLSKTLKLKICISCDRVQDAKQLIHAIMPFSKRWDVLSLQVPLEALSELSMMTSRDTPSLTSLRIQPPAVPGPKGASPMLSFNPFHLITTSPSLKSLSCSVLPSPMTFKSLEFLEELRLDLNPCETMSTLYLLQSCSQLRKLTLSGNGVTDRGYEQPEHPLVLTHLETLSLEHPVGRQSLLRSLSLPRLRHVWLGGRCGPGAGASTLLLKELKDLMQRSDVWSLESLVVALENHSPRPDLFLSFLASNPDLKTLRIDDTWNSTKPVINSNLLRALTLPEPQLQSAGMDSRCILLPRLRRVSLVMCPNNVEQDLARFLYSRSIRTDYTTPLKSIQLSSKRRLSSGLISAIESHRRRGSNVLLRFAEQNPNEDWLAFRT